MNFLCDDVTLWGVRTALELHEECLICKDYLPLCARPWALRSSRRQNRLSARTVSSNNSSGVLTNVLATVTGDAPKEITASPVAIRARHRLEEYHRQILLDKAQRQFKSVIQKKRREEFRHLREALYLVYIYKGPYLQRPGDKKKAAQYLRRHRFGEMFVNITEHEVKWKWLDHRVSNSDTLTSSDPFVNIGR
ncbi:hypothetical protein DFH28DRAFT_915127 [Melampsora americana]|nr:hypothetical protein DFH28DRAFT_915127 [Melampsora americana]